MANKFEGLMYEVFTWVVEFAIAAAHWLDLLTDTLSFGWYEKVYGEYQVGHAMTMWLHPMWQRVLLWSRR